MSGTSKSKSTQPRSRGDGSPCTCGLQNRQRFGVLVRLSRLSGVYLSNVVCSDAFSSLRPINANRLHRIQLEGYCIKIGLHLKTDSLLANRISRRPTEIRGVSKKPLNHPVFANREDLFANRELVFGEDLLFYSSPQELYGQAGAGGTQIFTKSDFVHDRHLTFITLRPDAR